MLKKIKKGIIEILGSVAMAMIIFLFVAPSFSRFTTNKKFTGTNINNNLDAIYEAALNLPEYSGELVVVLNNNQTFFNEEDVKNVDYKPGQVYYSELDDLGRAGQAIMIVGPDAMKNDEEREEIGMLKPSGWHTVKYPDQIEDNYLYNICHLIMWKMAGNDSNRIENLITGTRYFNKVGMLNMEILALQEASRQNFLYRVTPVYEGDNLVAKGVVIEMQDYVQKAKSRHCVFVYNIQPGIEIDYKTGESHVKE